MTRKIMIVDDDPYILIALREIFEERGYEVYTVNSGIDCIKELKHGFKGVILLDIMMPLMDGWQTLEEIKQNNLQNDNVISILTAKEYPGEIINDYRDMITDYITKPFDNNELINTVNNYYKN